MALLLSYSSIDSSKLLDFILYICSLFHNRLFELEDPSWAELRYFVKFLNTQLMACEHSVYCDEAVISDRSQGVYGFKSFVVRFMIRMAVVSRYGVCVWVYLCVCEWMSGGVYGWLWVHL